MVVHEKQNISLREEISRNHQAGRPYGSFQKTELAPDISKALHQFLESHICLGLLRRACRIALPWREMALDQSVFVPDQSQHHDIEDRQDDNAGSMRVRKAVELIDDEEAKDDKRSRIGPELISEQADDEEYLNKAVAEEIEGIEVLSTYCKVLCQA